MNLLLDVNYVINGYLRDRIIFHELIVAYILDTSIFDRSCTISFFFIFYFFIFSYFLWSSMNHTLSCYFGWTTKHTWTKTTPNTTFWIALWISSHNAWFFAAMLIIWFGASTRLPHSFFIWWIIRSIRFSTLCLFSFFISLLSNFLLLLIFLFFSIFLFKFVCSHFIAFLRLLRTCCLIRILIKWLPLLFFSFRCLLSLANSFRHRRRSCLTAGSLVPILLLLLHIVYLCLHSFLVLQKDMADIIIG